MNTELEHRPSEVVRKLLIELGAGTSPDDSPGSLWPIYVELLPDQPDEALCITDTPGASFGRSQLDGYVQENYGIQIKLRCLPTTNGRTRLKEIATAIDTLVLRNYVYIGSYQYLVQALSRSSDIINMGQESNITLRRLFSINYLVDLSLETETYSGTGTGTGILTIQSGQIPDIDVD